MTADAPLSASIAQPPPVGRSTFVFALDEWETLRDTALPPRTVSELGASEQNRLEFIRGATLIRRLGDRALPGTKVVPSQLLAIDVMAAGHQRNAFLLPRRNLKSTALIALGLGRAELREDYRVGVLTLTTGKAGRSRFMKDVVPALERTYPDKAARPFKIVQSAGQERVEFPSGGFMQWLSTEDDLRGEGFDFIILDEAGEADADKVIDVLGAALPTMDTRDGAQIAVSGTAGSFREGNLLWDWVEAGRRGDIGVLDYSADPDLTEEDIETWEQTEPLIRAVHPGIGILTPITSIKSNYETLTRATFLREYLNVFPKDSSSGFLNLVNWAAAARTGKLPEPPTYFRMAMSVNLLGTSAAIVAAWREEGKACFVVLGHGAGVKWIGAKVGSLQKYKTPVGYDPAVAPVQVEVDALAKRSPRPKVQPMTWPQISTAASLLYKEVDEGNIVHWDQDSLTRAVSRAGKRKYQDKRWAFKRITDEDDITALEAAAMALYLYDEAKPKRPYSGHLQT